MTSQQITKMFFSTEANTVSVRWRIIVSHKIVGKAFQIFVCFCLFVRLLSTEFFVMFYVRIETAVNNSSHK